MKIWHQDNSFKTSFLRLMCQKGILLVGPSGSGKTTLAEALTALDPAFSIVRNTTTRKARGTDLPGHFDYISVSTFTKRMSDGDFMFARIGDPPYYGYSHEAIYTSSSSGRMPVFMFRSSGLELFVNEGFNPWVVVLSGRASAVKVHSGDETQRPPSTQSIEQQLKLNIELAAKLDQGKVIYIDNEYKGFVEVDAFARAVGQRVKR